MDLLNISIFLNQHEIDDLKNEFSFNQIDFEVEQKFENDFEYQICEFVISEIIFDILPSNSFHKNWNFEIGIRLDSDADVSNTVKDFENINVEIVKHDSVKPYIVIKNTHGPFFFMQYQMFSEIDILTEINANVSNADYDEIKRVVGMLDDSISTKIRIGKSETDYTIENVKVKYKNEIKNGKYISCENQVLSLNFAPQQVQPAK